MADSRQREEGPVRCAEIQGVLFEYMARELGEGRADLVREHLRRCPDCQRVAAEIQQTLDALRCGAPDDARLSDDRRRRLFWSAAHPFLDWIQVHHIGVSIAVAVILVATVFVILVTVKPDWLRWERIGGEVTIGQGPAPAAGQDRPEPPPSTGTPP